MSRLGLLSAMVAAILLTGGICPPLFGVADPLRGEPFTDPIFGTRMPEDWIDKPIKYEDWAKGADIAVSLEQDLYYLILPLIENYARQNKLKIAVNAGTCGIAAGQLSRKTIDVGGYCCPPGTEDRLPGIKFHTLGIVSKAFFIHPGNPVEDMSAVELRNVFRGKISKWSELKTPSGKPGPDWTILTIGRFHCPLRPGHWRLLLENEDLFSRRLQEVGTIQDMLAKVASSEKAVGWDVLGMAEKLKADVKPLKINGVSPHDFEALASFKYPLYRAYSVTTWEGKARNPKADKLVEYLIREVEKIDAKRYGFASSTKLIKAGWKFRDNELVGEPR